MTRAGSTSGMVEHLLTRDETRIRDIVAREIVDFGVRGPFLDIGAGTGLWVAAVQAAGEQAYGVEPEASLVSIARATYGLTTLVRADGSRLPFPSDFFQWVQLCEVIEHVDADKAGAVFCEVHRVLRPGGTVRITTPNRLRYAAPSRRPLQSLRGLAGTPSDPAHVHEYWPWDLRRAIEDAGFDIACMRFREPNRYVRCDLLSAGVEVFATKK